MIIATAWPVSAWHGVRHLACGECSYCTLNTGMAVSATYLYPCARHLHQLCFAPMDQLIRCCDHAYTCMGCDMLQHSSCSLLCLSYSVWVGDGNIATVADACITVKITSQPVQQSAPRQSIRPKVTVRRPKSSWRRWLTCQDVQVDEPLLAAPEMQVPPVQVCCLHQLWSHWHVLMCSSQTQRSALTLVNMTNVDQRPLHWSTSSTLLLLSFCKKYSVKAEALLCVELELQP